MPVGGEPKAAGYIMQMFAVEDILLQDSAVSGAFWIFLVCGKDTVCHFIFTAKVSLLLLFLYTQHFNLDSISSM